MSKEKEKIKIDRIDENTAIKLKIVQNNGNHACSPIKTSYQASKKGSPSWSTQALRCARYLAGSVLLMGSIATVAHAQESKTEKKSIGEVMSVYAEAAAEKARAAPNMDFTGEVLSKAYIQTLDKINQDGIKRRLHAGGTMREYVESMAVWEVRKQAMFDEVQRRKTGNVYPKKEQPKEKKTHPNKKTTTDELSLIERLFNSISNTAERLLNPSKIVSQSQAKELIHYAAVDGIKNALLSDAISNISQVASATLQLFDQNSDMQLAFLGNDGQMLLNLLNPPPTLKLNKDRDAMIHQINERIAFNQKNQIEFNQFKTQYSTALVNINTIVAGSLDEDQNPLLAQLTLRLNDQIEQIENTAQINSFLYDLIDAIEGNEIPRIEQLSDDLSYYLSPRELTAIEHYVDDLIKLESHLLYQPSSYGMG